MLAWLHVMAALPNEAACSRLFVDYAFNPCKSGGQPDRNGMFQVPVKSGLGSEPSEEALGACRLTVG